MADLASMLALQSPPTPPTSSAPSAPVTEPLTPAAEAEIAAMRYEPTHRYFRAFKHSGPPAAAEGARIPPIVVRGEEQPGRARGSDVPRASATHPPTRRLRCTIPRPEGRRQASLIPSCASHSMTRPLVLGLRDGAGLVAAALRRVHPARRRRELHPLISSEDVIPAG
jgi:hypothetical protein